MFKISLISLNILAFSWVQLWSTENNKKMLYFNIKSSLNL